MWFIGSPLVASQLSYRGHSLVDEAALLNYGCSNRDYNMYVGEVCDVGLLVPHIHA